MTTFIAYRTAPNQEHRAATELRQVGIKAYVPRDRGRQRSPFTGKHPTPAPGYVFAARAYQPAFEKHVRAKLGRVDAAALGRLYLGRPVRPARTSRFAAGDAVIVTKGHMAEIPATVQEVRGRICIIAVRMFGKVHTQAVSETMLRSADSVA